MSNILFADEEEALNKINIDDLYDKNMKRDLKQLTLFNKILTLFNCVSVPPYAGSQYV